MTDERPTPPGVQMRDEVYDSYVRPVDRIGRQQPRPIGSFGLLKVAIGAGLPAPIKIPAGAWSQDVNDEGYTEAVVACPCGEVPHVEVGCLKGCDCERFYWFALDEVMVFNSPVSRTDLPTPAAS